MNMITKLISVPDWEELLNETGFADAPTAEDVEARIVKELTRGKVTFVDAGDAPIENGFRVTLRTESMLPKFNKEKTTVTVGAADTSCNKPKRSSPVSIYRPKIIR